MTRKSLTKNRCHHPKAALERTVIQRSDGGRGILDIARMQDQQIIGINRYMQKKKDKNPIIKAIVRSDEKLTPVNLSAATEAEVEERIRIRKEERITAWKTKVLHGRFYKELHAEEVDKEIPCAWIRSGYMFPETEGFMFAIQDQVVPTRNYKKVILKNAEVEDRCRKCGGRGETIQHILNGCEVMVTGKA